MSREQYTNAQSTTLSGSLTSSATSVGVTDGSSFPLSSFRLLVDNEVMFCTSRVSNTLTVVRGQEGSTAASHSSGAVCNHVMTKGTRDAFRHDVLAALGFVDASPSLSVDDDDFDIDGTLDGSWTVVGATSPATVVTVKNHAVSMSIPPGQSGASLTAILKNKTPSAGDWVQCGVSWGGQAGNFMLFGVIMSDGATYSSGNQVMFTIDPNEGLHVIFGWSNFTTQGSAVSNGTVYSCPLYKMHMRMVWESSNHYSCYLSPDGVSWGKVFSNTNIGSVGTPTHMGIIGTSYGSGNPGIVNFSYCRFSF